MLVSCTWALNTAVFQQKYFNKNISQKYFILSMLLHYVATYLRCGGIFNNYYTTNLLTYLVYQWKNFENW